MGIGMLLCGCAAPAPGMQLLRTPVQPPPELLDSATGQIRPDLTIDQVSRLSEAEESTAREAVIWHFERSSPDHYPKVESLHLVPGPTPDSYVFIANVRVNGFTPFRSRTIGLYERAKGKITVLEYKRSPWGTQAPVTEPFCPTEVPADPA
jgi:hypothetical protein